MLKVGVILTPSPYVFVRCCQGGSTGIIVLATVASLGSTAAFTFLEHSMLIRKSAAAAGGAKSWDDRDVLPGTHAERAPMMDPKEV